MAAKLFGRAAVLVWIACCMGASAANRANSHESLFDSNWRFLRADPPGANAPGFDDSARRLLDLPHDWSIEDLPSTNGAPPSPFNPALSAGGSATGYVVGGIGRYRKHLIGPDGKAAKPQESEGRVPAGKQQEFTQEFSIIKPITQTAEGVSVPPKQ